MRLALQSLHSTSPHSRQSPFCSTSRRPCRLEDPPTSRTVTATAEVARGQVSGPGAMRLPDMSQWHSWKWHSGAVALAATPTLRLCQLGRPCETQPPCRRHEPGGGGGSPTPGAVSPEPTVPRQEMPTSSECVHPAALPQGAWGQYSRRYSLPVHRTRLSQIVPLPSPKGACLMVEPELPRPSWLHTTLAASSVIPSSQTVPLGGGVNGVEGWRGLRSGGGWKGLLRLA